MIKNPITGGMLIFMGIIITGVSFAFSSDFFSGINLMPRILGIIMLISGIYILISSLKENYEVDLELAQKPKPKLNEHISCPKCYYRIPKNSVICPKCNKLLSLNEKTTSNIEISQDVFICPYCGENNISSNKRCIKCQKLLN